MSGYNKIPQERIERAARIYRTNRQAATALGIQVGTFIRLCKEYELESPHDRQRQEKARRKEGRATHA